MSVDKIFEHFGQLAIYIIAIVVLFKFTKSLIESSKNDNRERIQKLEDHITRTEAKNDEHIKDCNLKHDEANKTIQQILKTQVERRDDDIKILCQSVDKLCNKLDTE